MSALVETALGITEVYSVYEPRMSDRDIAATAIAEFRRLAEIFDAARMPSELCYKIDDREVALRCPLFHRLIMAARQSPKPAVENSPKIIPPTD